MLTQSIVKRCNPDAGLISKKVSPLRFTERGRVVRTYCSALTMAARGAAHFFLQLVNGVVIVMSDPY